MPNILRNLSIKEVSSVNRGAGEGVKILLMKHDKEKPMSKIGTMFSKFFGGEQNETTIDRSVEGLAESVGSIIKEAKSPEDLSKGLTETFEQFKTFFKKTVSTGEVVEKQEGSEMDLKVIAKSLGLPETATEAEVMAKIAKNAEDVATLAKAVGALSLDNAIAKAGFSVDELAFYNKATGEDDGTDTVNTSSIKKSFRLAASVDRGAMIKAAAPVADANLQKALDENADLKKRLDALEKKDNIAQFEKQAEELGLPAEKAVVLQKAYAGDKSAIDELIELTKAAQATEATGLVFKDFGHKNGKPINVGKAYDELQSKADELMKSDTKLTKEQAFTKVYTDPANKDLVAKERLENRPSAA